MEEVKEREGEEEGEEEEEEEEEKKKKKQVYRQMGRSCPHSTITTAYDKLTICKIKVRQTRQVKPDESKLDGPEPDNPLQTTPEPDDLEPDDLEPDNLFQKTPEPDSETCRTNFELTVQY